MICMKNLRFSSRPRAKVRRQGPLGSARAQPCVCKAGFHCNNNDNDDGAVALPTSVYLMITKMIMITKIIITITKFSSLIGYQLDGAIGQYASCLCND